MSTTDNLKDAFSGESMANRKYLAFAKKAEKDGYKQIAKLFRAAAAAETVHAHNHLDILDEVKSTNDNLQEAINGETFEFEQMYPGYIEEAKEEEQTKAEWSFDVANKVEKIHADLYQKALDNMGNNEEVDYYVCQVCGNTVENEAPDVCPICGAPKSKFEKIE
ncbi:rubrerythrin family protein [Methanohalobium sp.]|uniref:rubrerythrin family protein n=1 Tax=Methanohalobium sp. TaxID=2837493 RepID=UPI0025EED5BC|nr:rubrerythrin family protein [Methanohalobium sp.]